MEREKIGEFISGLRKSRNLTQKELAEQLGVTDKAVSKWERGAGYPDISMLRPLAEVLGTSVNELLEGEASNVSSDTDSKDLENALDYADKIITIKENRLGKLIAAILAISLLIAVSTCVIVEFAVSLTLSWSFLVIAGCVMGGCLFIPPLLYKKRGFFISLILLTVLIMPFLAVIEKITADITGYDGWLWKIGFPVSLIWLIFLWLMVVLRKLRLNIWFYISIGVLLCLPGDLLTNNIVDNFVYSESEFSRQFSNIVSILCILAVAGICIIIGIIRKGNKLQS